jgi:hypothetical protein
MTDDKGQRIDDRLMPSVFRLLISVLCLLSSVFCFSAGAQPIAQNRPASGDTSPFGGQSVTVFFTGNELGSMKPCGCSGGQLGGLERLDAVFNTVPSQNRLILDTGALVPESTEQNFIKFNVIAQAFSLLGYDLVNLTGQDITVARQAGLLDGLSRLFNCITAAPENEPDLPVKFTKQFSLAGRTIDVTILTADTAEQLSQLKETVSPSGNTAVNILILTNQDLAETSSNLPFIDCVLIPPHSDEPTLISNVNTRPLIITQCRLGKYVGQINIDIGSSSPPAKPRLSFRSVAVTEDLAQNQSLVELYRDYQRLVKEARLLEKYPKFPLPAHLQYVGSKSCKLCHDYEYGKWLTSPPVVIPGEKTATQKGRHANAMLSLVDVNSDYDPECVVCHVIGMDYETGFITSAQTPQLEDVGCENCHGPGSEHVRSLGAIQTAGPKSTCADCHTSEQSADFLTNEKQYNQKCVHWRPPKAPQPRRRIIREPNSPKIVK